MEAEKALPMFSVDSIFGSGGILSEEFDQYEPRDGQIRMAQLVNDTIRVPGENGIVEAACGIGKSFAYLFPAMISDKVVVIATSNIALQEQIALKDAPFVRDVLVKRGIIDTSYEVGYFKGKGNYICRGRFSQWEQELKLSNDADTEYQFGVIQERIREEGFDGDISGFPFIPTNIVKSKALGDRNNCLGAKCPYNLRCFYAVAKAKAISCKMIVVNYHLLFSHLMIREQTEGDRGILPVYDVLICDEGHEIPDVARSFWGINVSRFGIIDIAKSLEDRGINDTGNALRTTSDAFFKAVDAYYESEKYDEILEDAGFADSRDLEAALDNAEDEFGEYADRLKEDKKKEGSDHYSIDADIFKIRIESKRANLMKINLNAIVGQKDKNFVYWIEKKEYRNKGYSAMFLKGEPIDCSVYLRHNLFDSEVSVIVTSATLSTANDFSFMKNQIGMGPAAELIEESPFDFGKNAMLFCPVEVVNIDPNHKDFIDIVSPIVRDVIHLAGGRTLALFTSYLQMKEVYLQVRHDWDYMLMQGEKPRNQLADEFRENPRSVLFATSSFWTGIDVQGESLSVLIMNRIPFKTKGDPLNVWISRNVPYSFNKWTLPRAILLFKQGFGRLIRHKNDIGVFVMLDGRLVSKTYGSKFGRSLPGMHGTKDIKEVKAFFDRHGFDTQKYKESEPEPEAIELFDDTPDEDPFG